MDIIVGVAVVSFVALFVLRLVLPSRKRRKWVGRPGQKGQQGRNGPQNNWGMADPANQMEAISKVGFERIKLLNTSEHRVLVSLEGIVAGLDQGHRVMAQTTLGEVIRPKTDSADWTVKKNAQASINSKRLDFAVIDKAGLLALAVEYQGGGHYQGKAFMRDAVKREALRRADVPFLEVPKGMTPAELRAAVMKVLAA